MELIMRINFVVLVLSTSIVGLTQLINTSAGENDVRNIDLGAIQITNTGEEPVTVFAFSPTGPRRVSGMQVIDTMYDVTVDFSESGPNANLRIECLATDRHRSFAITAQHLNVECAPNAINVTPA
jgi:hypothetical protein